MDATLDIKMCEKENYAMVLNYVPGNVLPQTNTLQFLTETLGALVWLLLCHRETLMMEERDNTTAVMTKTAIKNSSNSGFTHILYCLLEMLEDPNRQRNFVDLIDTCDGSKLSVELYYLESTKSSDTDNYYSCCTYNFNFIHFNKMLGTYPPHLNNYGLMDLLANSIKSDFMSDPDLYKPLLDRPEISLVRVRLTLTFDVPFLFLK